MRCTQGFPIDNIDYRIIGIIAIYRKIIELSIIVFSPIIGFDIIEKNIGYRDIIDR